MLYTYPAWIPSHTQSHPSRLTLQHHGATSVSDALLLLLLCLKTKSLVVVVVSFFLGQQVAQLMIYESCGADIKGLPMIIEGRLLIVDSTCVQLLKRYNITFNSSTTLHFIHFARCTRSTVIFTHCSVLQNTTLHSSSGRRPVFKHRSLE